MDPGPDGIYLLIQLLILLLYILLSMADAAAQRISLSRHRKAAEGEDVEFSPLKEQAETLLSTPSAIRIAMMFLLLASFGLFTWQAVLPAAGAVAAGWGKGAPGLMTGLTVFFLTIAYLFFIQLLFAHLPRRLAAQKPRGLAKRVFPIAMLFHRLFRPMALLLDIIVNGLLKLFQVEMMQPTEEITEDEIRMLVDVGEEKGAIEEAEREMIENVFEFNNMTAAECMTHRTDVYAVWVDDTVEEITDTIIQSGLSRFPVYEEDLDHVIGTLTTRDFLLNQQAENPKPLRELLREARFVPESVRTDILFRDMQRNNYHLAIVVDEYGGTSGLITMEDLLEEIVGNIYDEYDPAAETEFTELAEGRWRVAGSLEVETFNRLTGFSLPLDEEYDTIGGLILSQLSSIPEEGSQPEVKLDGLSFKVESMHDRRIAWVEVNRINDEI
ncbi:MAG: hemolysin family protein [Eubacteriales bacterium]|nr:hemolysin family protein [Eubacteriales bacterium]